MNNYGIGFGSRSVNLVGHNVMGCHGRFIYIRMRNSWGYSNYRGSNSRNNIRLVNNWRLVHNCRLRRSMIYRMNSFNMWTQNMIRFERSIRIRPIRR